MVIPLWINLLSCGKRPSPPPFIECFLSVAYDLVRIAEEVQASMVLFEAIDYPVKLGGFAVR